MPALIAITEDVGAREERCTKCGDVIGIADFIVQATQLLCGDSRTPAIVIDYVHLDCDPDVKAHIEELRGARSGKASEPSAKQAKAFASQKFGRSGVRF